MRSRLLMIFISLSALSLFAFSQSSAPTDHKKVLVESVIITGTQSLSSADLAEITDSLAGGKFNDDSDELSQRIYAKFSDRGYMRAQVEKLEIKVLDPVANPKPVRLEAVVTERPLCHVSDVEFTGNHAVDSDKLRAAFPIKNGQTLRRSSVASGLEPMRTLYVTQGFLDVSPITSLKIDSNSTVKVTVEVREGPQYKMDQFEVMGGEDVAQTLRTKWELAPGTVYDATYLQKFLDKNHSLLPAEFTIDNGAQLLANCPEATVSVHLHLKHDVQHEIGDQAKRVPCKTKEDDAE
jgi:outer membrane protein assembly factor BamA